MLTAVPVINQKEFKELIHFGIRSGHNVLVLGPSGGGKTIMAYEATKEEGARLVYVNLSVLERTDFQGFPVPSDDNKRVNYATPAFLEFKDAVNHNEKTALVNLTAAFGDNLGDLGAEVKSRLDNIGEREKAQALVEAAPYLEGVSDKKAKSALENLVKSYADSVSNDEPIVFLFDEVDKASSETCQTLLELLQFHSINGRKLNIKGCILTGNLPDEHAHTNNISHAITKRCLTYKLDLDFKMWREWAFKNEVHTHIVQFLSSDSSQLYKTAPDGDPTAYALPSPRTWVEAGNILKHLEDDKRFLGMPEDAQASLRFKIISGSVGDIAGAKFRTWFQHYRRFDPYVNKLMDDGTFPKTEGYGASEILIMAISACSKVYAELKPNNKKRIEKVTKNVYKWMKTLPPDAQMGAIRLGFGGDWEKCQKYNLPKIPEFVAVFKDVKSKLGEWDSDLSNSK